MKTFKKSILLLLAISLSGPVAGQSFRSLLRKANQEFELHAFTKAIDTYQQALERRPDDEDALGMIADCYRHLNDMEMAAEYYARAVENRRVAPIHILNFAKTLKALGRYPEAQGYFIQYGQEGGDASIGNHYAETCEWAQRQGGPDPDLTVTNERVSTPAADFGPAFYNASVVFSSARTDIQRSTYDWDGQAKNQLFQAQMSSNGALQPPTFLKGEASERGEGPASFTSDGRYVAYTRNNFVSGVRHLSTSGMEVNIFLAEVGPDGDWYNEKPFPHNGNSGKTGYPAFTPDGEALFFAADRQGGYGGYDIYISYRQNNSWTYPINLGPAVNTPGDEIAPYFDGTNLFFASDWHIGFGGYDIFRAEQGNGEWTSVSNLGLPVNSPRDDFGYIFNDFRNVGYLASNRVGSRGAEDIYRVSKAGAQVVFRVVNAADGRPIPGARIDLSACSANNSRNDIFSTDGRGRFTFPVDASMNCEVLVSGQGYTPKRYPINGMQLMAQGEVEIPLIRENEQFFGKVVDRNSRRPIEGITVIAYDQMANNEMRAVTGQDGSYAMPLQPNKRYTLRFSGPGYREVSKNVVTGPNPTSDVLGSMPLFRVGYVPPDDNLPDDDNTGAMQSGYAVQLGVLSKRPDLSRFDNVRDIGRVYIVEEGGRYKVRVGVYNSQSAASDRVSSIRSRGYKDAFVVRESGASGSASVDDDVYRPDPPVTGGRYKIQLAALRNTRYFDPSDIRQYGTIEDFPRGDLTIKLLSGFRTLQEARRALPQVQQRGFSGAFIVEEVNGQLRKVRN